MRLAIIGAGISSLSLANFLKDYGQVTIFEKSRGIGGRIATRYHKNFNFDHGAQFFTVKSTTFKQFLEPSIRNESLRMWPARFIEIKDGQYANQKVWNTDFPHYVGVPNMNSFLKNKSIDHDIKLETNIKKIKKIAGKWNVFDQDHNEYGLFDWVFVTAPYQQTKNLIEEHCSFSEQVTFIKMKGCFTLMVEMEHFNDLGWDAALVRDKNISWISINSSKPSRGSAKTMVIHSTNDWADTNMNLEKKEALRFLLNELDTILPGICNNITFTDIHRWRYANVDKQNGQNSYLDPNSKIGACGDWFIKGRVESGFSSAEHLFNNLKTLL